MQPPQASGRHGGRFGIYNALLRDPDGYLVELQEFCEADEHARFVGRRGFAWLGQLWGLGLCSRYLVATDDAFDGITPCAVHQALSASGRSRFRLSLTVIAPRKSFRLAD